MQRLRGPWLTGLIGVVVLALGFAVFAVADHQAEPAPSGGFYVAPEPLPAGPAGTIVRTEPFPHAPVGSRAWKILYLSRSYTGRPAALSGLIFVPDTPPPDGGREVVALTHGTVDANGRSA
jgi:hypothetical protein